VGQNWNRKRSVEESPTQWSVILAILVLLLLPCAGLGVAGYSFLNGETTGVVLVLSGFCLLALALPLLALFYLRRRSVREWQRRQDVAD